MTAMICRVCGASDGWIHDGALTKCKYCTTTYQAEREHKIVEKLLSLLDEKKQEDIANLRQRMYKLIHEDPPDNKAIVETAVDIQKLIPDDFIANFYEKANRGDQTSLIKFINEIDVSENYAFIEGVIKYLIKSLTSPLVLPVGNLIERALQQKVFEVQKYNEIQSLFESEAQKVESDMYNPRVTRDFFVMYSGKDMDKVMKLVSYIESQDHTCFVALRNIQHGRGSREEYISLIKTAIDYCECVLFVSSTNSRRNKCEALSVEMDYIRSEDKKNAPPEYRNLPYYRIPSKYKKHRIEYLIELPDGGNVLGEKMVKEFFYGLEYIKDDPAQVIYRYANYNSGEFISTETGGGHKAESQGIAAFKNKDFGTAVDIFEEEAKEGNAQSQCNLGYCYEVGLGVERNCREAVKWYETAAQNGNARAMYNLGVCYESGLGVNRDPHKAHDMIAKAATKGDVRAKEWLKSN